MRKPHTILIAEDYERLRNQMVSWVGMKNDFVCVSTAEDGEDALRKIQLHEPEIAFVDITMPKLDGIGLLERLMEIESPTKVIILSAHCNEMYVRIAVQLGCCGYIHKSEPEEIWDAVYAVLAGQKYFSKLVVDSVGELK